MENLLVSACLMGFECKYCSGSNYIGDEKMAALKEKYVLIPVCPESAGGLPTPRDPSERIGDKVMSSKGVDVTANYKKGADVALWLCKKYGCKKALLKAKSPSCGRDVIYDGTFTGTLTQRHGVTTELLIQNNIEVFSEKELDKLGI